MSQTSRRTKVWVWSIVLALFAGAAWFTFDTLRSSVQPFSVLSDPFPQEHHRPQGPDGRRSAVNFMVIGQAQGEHQTLSIFHLADGRRRVDVLNFPAGSSHISNLEDVAGTVAEVEQLTAARMEHVMLWDLEFMAEFELTGLSVDELGLDLTSLSADQVWSYVLQETFSVQDAGQLRSVAESLTPYIAADQHLDAGRIADLSKSLRYVSPSNVSSCVLPDPIEGAEYQRLLDYFKNGNRRCAELF